MCGPGIVPSSTTRARCTPKPTRSRTLVKPAISPVSMLFTALAAMTGSDVFAVSSTFADRIPIRWPWQSHIPGMTAGTRSTRASAGTFGAPSIGPAYAIVGPSMTTHAFRIGSPRPGIRTSASMRSIRSGKLSYGMRIPPPALDARRLGPPSPPADQDDHRKHDGDGDRHDDEDRDASDAAERPSVLGRRRRTRRTRDAIDRAARRVLDGVDVCADIDRKSTRLNSS